MRNIILHLPIALWANVLFIHQFEFRFFSHPKLLALFHYFIIFLLSFSACQSPKATEKNTQVKNPLNQDRTQSKKVKLGAEVFLENYLQLIANKRIAIVANPTSVVETAKNDSLHLVDALKGLSTQHKFILKRVFAPEHGFRGKAEAGENVNDQIDSQTQLPIISLYGKNKKPTPQQLADIDIVIYDIQDVGARFYTYITTLSYVMEACAENNKKLIILDRPNPNGDYVDGPVMQSKYTSFVGLHPIPIVHGLTIGEYAKMVKGENWQTQKGKNIDYNNLQLTVITMENYTHKMQWEQTGRKWIPPSPNLMTPTSARYYPMLCWFEGTAVSVGRGTAYPFEQIGFPYHLGCQKQILKDSALQQKTILPYQGLESYATSFVPKSIAGKALHPPFENQKCFGLHIQKFPDSTGSYLEAGIALLKNFYDEYYAYFTVKELPKPDKPFFNPFFERLSGNQYLREAIETNRPPHEIVQHWKAEIAMFKKSRKKYLLYTE